MSFSMKFFATDVDNARSKLAESLAVPAAVKALVELAIAGIPSESRAVTGAGSASIATDSRGAGNSPRLAAPRLRGILVETHGHIGEFGSPSNINVFRVEPVFA